MLRFFNNIIAAAFFMAVISLFGGVPANAQQGQATNQVHEYAITVKAVPGDSVSAILADITKLPPAKTQALWSLVRDEKGQPLDANYTIIEGKSYTFPTSVLATDAPDAGAVAEAKTKQQTAEAALAAIKTELDSAYAQMVEYKKMLEQQGKDIIVAKEAQAKAEADYRSLMLQARNNQLAADGKPPVTDTNAAETLAALYEANAKLRQELDAKNSSEWFSNFVWFAGGLLTAAVGFLVLLWLSAGSKMKTPGPEKKRSDAFARSQPAKTAALVAGKTSDVFVHKAVPTTVAPVPVGQTPATGYVKLKEVGAAPAETPAASPVRKVVDNTEPASAVTVDADQPRSETLVCKLQVVIDKAFVLGAKDDFEFATTLEVPPSGPVCEVDPNGVRYEWNQKTFMGRVVNTPLYQDKFGFVISKITAREHHQPWLVLKFPLPGQDTIRSRAEASTKKQKVPVAS